MYSPNFPGGIDAIDNTSDNSNDKIAGFGLDFTIKPTLINQFHAGFMYQASFFSPENLGLDGSTITEQVWKLWIKPLRQQLPRQAISSYYPMLSWTDSLNWQKGNTRLFSAAAGSTSRITIGTAPGADIPKSLLALPATIRC